MEVPGSFRCIYFHPLLIGHAGDPVSAGPCDHLLSLPPSMALPGLASFSGDRPIGPGQSSRRPWAGVEPLLSCSMVRCRSRGPYNLVSQSGITGERGIQASIMRMSCWDQQDGTAGDGA